MSTNDRTADKWSPAVERILGGTREQYAAAGRAVLAAIARGEAYNPSAILRTAGIAEASEGWGEPDERDASDGAP